MKFPQVYSPVVWAMKIFAGGGLYDLISSRWASTSLSRKSLTSELMVAAEIVAGSTGRAVCPGQTGRRTAKKMKAINICLSMEAHRQDLHDELERFCCKSNLVYVREAD